MRRDNPPLSDRQRVPRVTARLSGELLDMLGQGAADDPGPALAALDWLRCHRPAYEGPGR